jgi:uncharacterized phage protein gp47/JayE
LSAPPVGVDNIATVVILTGGTDGETDDELRARVLQRIREPPMGGDATDYVAWAEAVPGVTRAWSFPQEMGIGTVTVRFMMDQLRADSGGFPIQIDIDTVTAYLNTVRPVTVKDFWVVAPIPQPIDLTIANLNPDNQAVREQIIASVGQMLFEQTAPGQTIYAAWKSFAVMSAPGVISFDLVDAVDDVMPDAGHLAVLGNVYFTTTPTGFVTSGRATPGRFPTATSLAAVRPR